jgi:hypothetical protein
LEKSSVTEKSPSSTALDIRRWLLGVLALLMLAAGAIIVYAEPWGGEAKPMGAACLRVGIVLAAAWLALPELVQIPKWMFVSLLVAVVIVVWRPPTVVIVAPALLLLWALRGIAKTVE